MSRENSLVSTQWVEDNIDTPGIVLIEVDEDTTAYDKGHIKGAIKLDWTTDLQDQVRRDFVNKEQFEALLSSRGVGNDDTVVLYGGNNNWFAAYAYWYFTLYGHNDVKLMDGGRKKWELDSRELTDELPTRAATTYVAQDQDSSIRAFRDDAVAAIGVQNLIDVRSPDEYAGRLLAPAHLPQEQSQRAGHIPTSLNVPWSKNANDDGTFKSDADLKALYAEVGIDDSKDTIALCRIGERSSLTWFVLKELLGHQNVKNYDGSWTEYGSLVGVPIALGDEPGRPEPCVEQLWAVFRSKASTQPRKPSFRARSCAAACRWSRRTFVCSTARVSSPPRCRPRRPATSGSSPVMVSGRCGPWPPRPSPSTPQWLPRSARWPRCRSQSDPAQPHCWTGLTPLL